MSLTSTLALDDATGDEVTWVLLSQDANGSRRLDSASTNAEPGSLVIRHSVAGSGINAVDRHLVQFSRTLLDSENVPRTAIVNFTVAVPRASVITNAICFDLISNLIDLIADGGFTASGIAGTTLLTQLLRGES